MTKAEQRALWRLIECAEDALAVLDDAAEAGVKRARGLAKRIDRVLPVVRALCPRDDA